MISGGAIWSKIGNEGRYVDVELGVMAVVEVDVGEVDGRSTSVSVRPITYLLKMLTMSIRGMLLPLARRLL